MARDMGAAPKVAVVDFHQQDVLLGRGTGPNEHQGNRFFRSLVKQKKEEYTSCTGRSGKDRIVTEVIHAVWASGGRFLKKREKGKHPGVLRDSCTVYEVADKATVLEKTRQVFQYFGRRKRADSVSTQVSEVSVAVVASAAQSHGPVSYPDSLLSERPVEATVTDSHGIYSSRLAEDIQSQLRTYQLGLHPSRQVAFVDERLARLLHQPRMPLQVAHMSAQEALFNSFLSNYLLGSLPHSSSSNMTSPETSLRLALHAELHDARLGQHPLPLTWRWQQPSSAAPHHLDWRSIGQVEAESNLSAIAPFGAMPALLDAHPDSFRGIGDYRSNLTTPSIQSMIYFSSRHPRGPPM
jgi:hypothetical protein